MFYCPHADGNQCIRIRENTLEFSLVLSTLFPYLSVYVKHDTIIVEEN